MKIASIEYRPFRRRFRTPFTTSRGAINYRTGWIIRILADDGTNGFGEAGNSLLTAQSMEETDKSIKHISGMLRDSYIPEMPDAIEDILEGMDIGTDPAVRFGLENALCDLSARIAEKPLCEWLGAKFRDEIPVNFLVTGPVDDPDKLKNGISNGGYTTVKVKVGAVSIDEDVKAVAMLREAVGPDIAIRLDANRGWAFDQAVEALSRLKRFDIEYIEEPLDKYNPGRMKALRKVTGIKIVLDESLAEIDDIKGALSTGLCDLIILKPAVIGGIVKTYDLYNAAKRSGHQAVITSNLETEIGIAAQLHLAAALPGEIPPFGLDTIRLYEGADIQLSKVENGIIRLPDGNGIGIGDEIWKDL